MARCDNLEVNLSSQTVMRSCAYCNAKGDLNGGTRIKAWAHQISVNVVGGAGGACAL